MPHLRMPARRTRVCHRATHLAQVRVCLFAQATISAWIMDGTVATVAEAGLILHTFRQVARRQYSAAHKSRA